MTVCSEKACVVASNRRKVMLAGTDIADGMSGSVMAHRSVPETAKFRVKPQDPLGLCQTRCMPSSP